MLLVGAYVKMGIAKESMELASLIQRSVFLGVPLGFKYLLKYDEGGQVSNVILTRLDYKLIGKVKGADLEVYVPDGTMEIGEEAFGYEPYLLNFRMLKVYLPSTCTKIHKSAFNTVMLPLHISGNNIVSLEAYSFKGLRSGSVLSFPSLYVESLSSQFITTLDMDEVYLNFKNFNGTYNNYMSERWKI